METIARIKKAGKHFEILVDLDKAIELKQKLNKLDDEQLKLELSNVLAIATIFTDHKKGLKPSTQDLVEAFGTDDVYKIAKQILLYGELQLPTEYRAKLREEKLKQIISFLARNAIDTVTRTVPSPERIEKAIKEAGIKIDEFKSVDEQINRVISELQKVLPLKLEVMQLEVIVPAAYTGKAYSFLARYNKQQEEWLDDGSLRCIVTIPTALQAEFYNKLNKLTNGTALTKDLGVRE